MFRSVSQLSPAWAMTMTWLGLLFLGLTLGITIGWSDARLVALETKVKDMEARAANAKQWPLASAYCYVQGRQVGLLSDYGDPNRVYAPPSMAEEFAKATPDNPIRCVIVAFEKGTLTYGDDRMRLEPDHIYFPYFDGSQSPYLWWRANT